MKLTKREQEMTYGRVLPLLFKFGIPTMLGMIINAVYNLVDTYFVGGFGMVQTAAVSLVFPLTLLTTGFGSVFGSGAGSKISRLLGDRAHARASEYCATALASAVVCGVALSAVLLIGLRPMLLGMGADAQTLPYAMQYGTILILGFPFSLFNITANNLAVSEGSTGFSSAALLLGAGLNMVLDPLFVLFFRTGVEGVAYATVIASGVSTAMYAVHFLRGRGLLRFSLHRIKPSRAMYVQMCKIGVPLLAFQLLNMAALSVTNVLAVRYGNPSVAAFGITYKLFCIEVNAVFGFLKGYQPLAGYNYGANRPDRVKGFTSMGVLVTTVFCVACNVLLIAFAPQAIGLFNQDSAEVLHFGAHVLRVQAVGYMTLGVQFVGASYFLAIGRAREGGILSMCRGVLFLLLGMLLNAAFGRSGLLAAYPLTELCACTATAAILYQEKRRTCSGMRHSKAEEK